MEEQIRTLQEEYDKGVNEKESLGKRLIAHSRQKSSDFQKEEEFSESDHSILKDLTLCLIMSNHVWGKHTSAVPVGAGRGHQIPQSQSYSQL